jgi:hypothetical protein
MREDIHSRQVLERTQGMLKQGLRHVRIATFATAAATLVAIAASSTVHALPTICPSTTPCSVPEPTSLILLGTGLAAGAIIKRLRK